MAHTPIYSIVLAAGKGRRTFGAFLAWVVIVSLGPTVPPSVQGQATRPGRGAAVPAAGGDHALEEAIEILTEEAESIKAGRLTAGREPDFPTRFGRAIDEKELADAIGRRLHRDRFIDAYSRWQLTSFDPPLPAFDERAFVRFVRNAPALLENPRADPRVVALFRRVHKAGPLSSRDVEQVRQLSEQLDARTAWAETMNIPARGFGEWVQARLEPAGMRSRQWLLARLLATIRAGWAARSLKSAITRSFGESASDRSFSRAQRRSVARLAQRLIGLERESVDTVTFLANGSVRVTFSTSRVNEDDVQRWIERLAGRETRATPP